MNNDLFYLGASLVTSGIGCASFGQPGYGALGIVTGVFCAALWWGYACNYKKKVLEELARELQKENEKYAIGSGKVSNLHPPGETFDAVVRVTPDGTQTTIAPSQVGQNTVGIVELEIDEA